MAASDNQLANARIAPACRHCSGTGREPAPITFDFSQAGERRGELARLAERTGLDASRLSRMFTGSSIPTLPTIILTAEALGVSESALIHSPPIWHRVLQELSE